MSDWFPARILDRLDELSGRTVFEYAGTEVSGAQTLTLVRRVTAALRSAGAGPGSGVALTAGVSPAGFAANLAAHVVGARVSGVRPGLTQEQLTYLLDERIGWALVDATTARDPIRKARPDLVLIDVDDPGIAEADDLSPRGRPGDVARVTYTSGSTGNPKGCAQTYAALREDWPARTELHSEVIADLRSRLDRYLLHGTLSSAVMLDYAYLTLLHGGRLVIPARDAPFPDLVARYRISGSIITVPKLLSLLAAVRAGATGLSTLRGLMVSGSPLDPRRYAEALDRLGPIVFQGYGQSECGLISMLSPDQAIAFDTALHSVGQPLPRNQVRMRDGELYVRTPQQTIGYVNQGDIETEQAEVYTDDGWIRTRDLGHLDGRGYLRLEGRARDVVIVDANVYYAGPIERVLAGHPAVDQAYVVGVPDESTGEAIEAFLVVRPTVANGDLARLGADLRRLVTERLGAAWAPRGCTVIDEVPLTPGGKPDKKALRQRSFS